MHPSRILDQSRPHLVFAATSGLEADGETIPRPAAIMSENSGD